MASSVVDLVVDVGEALVDARLVEVGDEHRHLQPAHEQQRELAGHQAGADDADLGDRLRERLVGRADRALGALLHEIEGVHGCRELVAGDEVGERLVLARRSPRPSSPLLAAFEQLERARTGDFGTVPMRLSSIFAGDARSRSATWSARSILPGSFLRLTLIAPPSTPSAQRSESSRKFAGGEDRVDDAEVERLLGPSASGSA